VTSQAALNVRVSTSENDRFLDHFRYSIITSQLLVPEASAPIGEAHTDQLGHEESLHQHAKNSFSLRGAAVAISLSFFLAWMIHWARSRSYNLIHWLNVSVFMLLLLILSLGAYAYARRKDSQKVRRMAVSALSDLISQSHALDTVARSAFGLIQEVEIVSRGYEM
jgi:cytochrome bd-type quinol oxidase subunit 2